MLWVKAFHIIFVITWFGGLFYLPRLYVYHSMASDTISIERFKMMEYKLYYYIMTPGAILAIVFGLWLASFNLSYYLHSPWMHAKLGLVFLLIFYHWYLGRLLKQFKNNVNTHGHIFYRILNELPAVFLLLIVILVVVKPF